MPEYSPLWPQMPCRSLTEPLEKREPPSMDYLRRHRWFACLVLFCALSGCRARSPDSRTGADSLPVPAPTEAGAEGDDICRAFEKSLSSPDFDDGAPIPKRHAYRGEGENVPPRLAWDKVPARTKELALIVDDPDAPMPEPWVHEVFYGIPVGVTTIDPLVRSGAMTDSMARFFHGKNSWGEHAWGGPMPPPGAPHRYIFTLYALDRELGLDAGQTKEQLLSAMKGRILCSARLTGTYQR